MSAHDRDDGYADFAPRGKPGRPRRIGWEHPATEQAVARAASALADAAENLRQLVAGEVAIAQLEDSKSLAECAVRELALAAAGERLKRGLNR